MNKDYIVKNNRDFSNIIKNGRFVKNNFFVIYVLSNNVDKYRFGISVGKKIGNAVLRNKVKRQLRNVVYKYKKNYHNGFDYIIIVRNSYINLKFSEVEDLYLDLINKINIILSEEIKNEKK